METTNKLFRTSVNKTLHQLSCFRKQTNLIDDLYISRHFAERIVERNLDKQTHFIFKMLGRCVCEMKQTTYSNRIYKLRWKTWIVIAKIASHEISGRRYVVASTIYPNDDPKIGYDEEIVF